MPPARGRDVASLTSPRAVPAFEPVERPAVAAAGRGAGAGAPHAADPRGFSLAPQLVWFRPWREARVRRSTRERHTAALVAPDGVRRAARPIPGPQPSSAALDSASAAVRGVPVGASVALKRSLPTAVVAAELSRAGPAAPSQAAAVRAAGSRPNVAPVAPLGAMDGATLPRASWGRGRAIRVEPLAWPALDSQVQPETAPAELVTRLVEPLVARPAIGRALGVVTQALREGVSAEVRAEVRRTMERVADARPSAAAPPAAPSPAAVIRAQPAALAHLDDRVATALLDRMRLLMREERFRRGRLR